jgi:hypothetical protein
VFCMMLAGFTCAHATPAVIVNARMPVVSFIGFPYLLNATGVGPGLAAALTGGSMS